MSSRSVGLGSATRPVEVKQQPNETFNTSDVAEVDNNEDEDLYENDEDTSQDEQQKEFDPSWFKPRNKLPGSAIHTWTLYELMGLIDGPYLGLAPQYQRDVVWKQNKMVGLIDSLMENFYIPPIIFNRQEVKADDGTIRHKRICVDGKQRLTSVSKFVRGHIGCHDRYGKLWYYRDKVDEEGNPEAARRRLILPEDVKRNFRSKTFVCYEFSNLSPKQEEDLFARVQLGVALTPAEKLQATDGPWQKFARLFERDFGDVVKLTSTDRAGGFQRVLECFNMIIEVQHPTAPNGVPRLRSGATKLKQLIDNTAALDDAAKSHFGRVFTTFKELAEEDPQTFKDNSYQHSKKFAPIEFVAVAVLISVSMDRRTRTMLLGDIRALRQYLRTHFKNEIKMNEKVWSAARTFIDDIESFRGAVDNSMVAKKLSANTSSNAGAGPTTTKTSVRSSTQTYTKPTPKSSADGIFAHKRVVIDLESPASQHQDAPRNTEAFTQHFQHPAIAPPSNGTQGIRVAVPPRPAYHLSAPATNSHAPSGSRAAPSGRRSPVASAKTPLEEFMSGTRSDTESVNDFAPGRLSFRAPTAPMGHPAALGNALPLHHRQRPATAQGRDPYKPMLGRTDGGAEGNTQDESFVANGIKRPLNYSLSQPNKKQMTRD
ncbi:hypothetical protein B0A49_12075 [Cryomyces minteri]|uniref:GmrSD restriction endonucleases N-terminal domain-containing protein n=1 Tax=Cryomyces minteri TaxID=331657 RepID=A0A4U0VSN5_9PEZI|nr:hypothetical protein B0A49_12075 [Cryomyces minteri]